MRGGGEMFNWPKTSSHKKVYHKINQYLFDYLISESFTHLQYRTKIGIKPRDENPLARCIYGLVLFLGLIRLLCFMLCVDGNISAYAHYY